ncbi:MAG: hypothetical protein KKH68_14005 [Proteobacteria bacterium]|nr:hypothetical protein [Pseudomonadota bacterium]
MRKALMFLMVIALLLGPAVSAMAFEVGVRGYYWFANINGDISVDGNNVYGTNLNLEDNLGMDQDSYPVIEVFGGLGKHHLSLARYSVNYEGSRVLTGNIAFNGLTFNTGTSINTSLDYDVYDFMYRIDLLDLENILAGGSLGIVARVEVFDGSAEVKSALASTSQDFTVPIPMVGLNCHVGILADILEARVLVTGIGYSGSTVFDSQADISFTPFPFLDLHAGYRIFYIDVETDDVKLNYNTAGPYVALTVSF